MEKDMGTYLVFELNSGSLRIDQNDLEAMKQAMVAFFHVSNRNFPKKYLEVRELFAAELDAAACWLNETSAEIGVWRLENQNGCLVLVRYPEFGPNLDGDRYIFHAKLRQGEVGWEVVAIELEREFGPE